MKRPNLISLVPKLIGGGCMVEDYQLIMGYGVQQNETHAWVSQHSYGLAIDVEQTIPGNGSLAWDMLNRSPFPGDLIDIGSDSMVHLIGGHFAAERWEDVQLTKDTLSALVETDLEDTPKLTFHLNIDTSKYIKAVLTGMRIGCPYNGDIYFLFNTHTKAGDELRVLSKANFKTKEFSNYTTQGSPPLYQTGLSVAQTESIIYVATGNSIHVLSLSTAYWTHYSIPGFVAAKSGCLYLQGATLIHAFGTINQEYASQTQFIDINTWKLTNTYSPYPVSPANHLPYIIGALVILNVVLVSALLYKLLKRKRSPKMLTRNIWADPNLTYSIDMSLSTPSLFDPTLHTRDTCLKQPGQ